MSSVGDWYSRQDRSILLHSRRDDVTEGNIDCVGYIYAMNTVEKS